MNDPLTGDLSSLIKRPFVVFFLPTIGHVS